MIGYLVSRYPAVSHTFILREIEQLRTFGFEITTASINEPDRPKCALDENERLESDRTYYVKQQGAIRAASSVILQMIKSPLTMFRTWGFAYYLAGMDIKRLIKHTFYFIEAVLLLRWIQEKGIRHLHGHFANPAATVLLLASRLSGVPYSLTVHGPDEFYDVTAANIVEKIREAAFVICISYYTKSQLMRFSQPSEWEKLEVVYLGVDIGKFEPEGKRSSSGECRVLCVGRLFPTKGQFVLIEAFEKLMHKKVKAKLEFVGDGPDRPMLEKRVVDKGLEYCICFRGALNPEKVLENYRSADIVVLPSFAEGLPVVLMEAMAMEIPCISSGINGIPELIQSGLNGWLIPPGDVDALAEALHSLVQSAELRSSLGTRARNQIVGNFNLFVNMQKLAELLKKKIK